LPGWVAFAACGAFAAAVAGLVPCPALLAVVARAADRAGEALADADWAADLPALAGATAASTVALPTTGRFRNRKYCCPKVHRLLVTQ
jgi:hypothetical protein